MWYIELKTCRFKKKHMLVYIHLCKYTKFMKRKMWEKAGCIGGGAAIESRGDPSLLDRRI